MSIRAVLLGLGLAASSLVTAAAHAQQPPPTRDSTRAPQPQAASADSTQPAPRLPLPRSARLHADADTLVLRVPPILGMFGAANPLTRIPGAVADQATRRFVARRELMIRARWDSLLTLSYEPRTVAAVPESVTVTPSAPVTSSPRQAPVPVRPPGDPLAPRDSSANPFSDVFGALPDLGFRLNSTLASKIERSRNERCTAVQVTVLGSNCTATWSPNFDFQFDVLTGGVVADRVHLNVDYDSHREFDASNNISVRYQGKQDEAIESIEFGNISFAQPASRFITSGIPSGNYGMQARGQLGPMRWTTVIAQQKGNISKDRTFSIGDRTLQSETRALEDVGMELRRFFLTVDPRRLPGYPNIDILNRSQMQRLAVGLPDSLRPTRVYVYRQLVGATNPNPRGPQLSVRGARNSSRQIYEVLRENVDYYLDPSQLWISLVRPLSTNERLAVAYEVNVNGAPGRNINTGGTPDIEFTEAPQFANLLWEPELQPTDTGGYFQREIKSVYRLGGAEIRRETIGLKLVTGTSGDQEKPQDQSRGETYLQMFGLSQATNAGAFDVENRVWPRPQDPNLVAGDATQHLIRDNFVVFPSLQPFARAGLAQPLANPANDTLYTYPNEYLYSTQRPQSIFRMLATYLTEGSGETNSLTLGSLQVRPLSERVLLDGQPLVRDVDYKADYALGVISFNRGDTLFLRPRQVVVRFEENPLFNSSPTSILAFGSQFPMENGQVSFTAISQQQRSSYNRPPLGFEPAGSLVAGLTANFNWNANVLSRAIGRLPVAPSTTPSRIGLSGEIAVSRPQPNSAGQAYVESFEGSAGRTIGLSDAGWSLSSQPAAGSRLLPGLASNPLTLNRVSTLAFQSVGLDQSGNPLQFTIDQIDPGVNLAGNGIQSPEQLLWLTLYPLSVGGVLDNEPGTNVRRNAWTVGPNTSLGPTPTGRHWGSIQTILNPSGEDLSRIENIELWALVQTDPRKIDRNPTLLFDLGDISENRVAFAPETLIINPPVRSGLKPDTTYHGKRLAGYDRFDSERDRFSRAFNAVDNDVGIAGSIADTIIVVDNTKGGIPTLTEKVPICSSDLRDFLLIGDSRANCTVRNSRLDEEDIDLDGQLNLKAADIDREQWKRFAVNLADRSTWSRTGRCRAFVTDSTAALGAVVDTLCWVQIRLNWRAPLDSLNAPSDRRMRALRLTMISGAGETETGYSRTVLAGFKLIGAPWLRRGDRPLSGVAGDSAGALPGYVVSSVIGTQDSSSTLHYQAPPGVIEAPESKTQSTQNSFDNTLVQVNEHALRLQAGTSGGQFPVFGRAEAYVRFPEGNKTFMGYRSLRVWMRGRGNGWGPNGELNAFIKVGRDENNFYFYRTTAQAGETVAAWEPELRVDLTRFQALRAQLENNSLRNSPDSLACSGVDLELIKRSGLPRGVAIRRYAVCQDGYIVYTADPGITPPNLAGVQEMAVGFMRIDSVPRGGSAISPGDTLELWVDDVRLTDVVDDMGFAGEIGLFANAGDLADFRLNLSRRDPNFRQLGETPSFLTATGVSAGTTLHLERLLPRSLGIVLPMTVAYGGTGIEQFFINRTDVRADGIQGLRNPRDSRVDYAVAMRRATPVTSGWFAPLVNGLTVNGTWGQGRGQSAFQEGENTNYTVSAALNIDGLTGNDETRDARLPGIIDRTLGWLPSLLRESDAVRGLRAQRLRWRPSRFVLSSSLARTANTTTSFLKPAFIASDTGQAVRTLSHLWLNSSILEFRPIRALTAQFNARQVLDLRDYQKSTTFIDSLDRGLAAHAERLRVLGADIGLERERSLNSRLDFRPGVALWLQPVFTFNSNFTLYKDPNASALLRDGADSTGTYRLPKRLGASQALDASLLFDAGRLLTTRTRVTSRFNRLGRAILPFSVAWSRSLTSNYDNTAFTPGLGYQFGLGGVDDFRGISTQLATAAGRVGNLTATGSVRLPYSFTLQSNFQHGTTETWTRRILDNFQALITSDNTTYPDVSGNWSWRPLRANRAFSGIGGSVRYQITESNTLVLNETGSIAQRSSQHNERQEVAGQVSWTFLTGLLTDFRLTRSTRDDIRPGSVTRDHPTSQAYTVSKPFKLPQKWNTRGNLRTRIGYSVESAVSIVEDAPGLNGLLTGTGIPSVLSNNGRRQVNFGADTDLSNAMSFSLTGSHAVTFDRNYNRQTSQSVLSTILTLHFGAGQLR